MLVYFNRLNGKVVPVNQGTVVKKNLTVDRSWCKVYVRPGKYLKATIMQISPTEFEFFPQILSKLSLRCFPLEKYYRNLNNALIALDTTSLTFPKQCRYR
ncbi:MAG: hypothetical protein RLZZ499_3413 [Cyanobacteriota bacterium]|jgi:hypothetical protein